MIGPMRARIAIESKSASDDGAGGAMETWTLIAVLWAEIEWGAGEELPTADGLEHRQRATLRLRQRNDIEPAMRAVWGTRIMNIQAIEQDSPARGRMTLRCISGSPS